MNSAIKKSLDCISKSNFADALYLLKKILRKNSKDIQALNVLGQVQIKLGEYKNAVSSLEKSVAINAYDFNILAKLGYAYEKTADFDKAINSYKQSLALNPEQPHVYDCLGRTLAKDKQNYEAILYLMKALEAKPHDKELHLNIGFASKDTGLYDITIKHYQAANELDPTDERSLSCLLFNSHKDPARGFADFQKLAIEYSQQVLTQVEDNYTGAVQKRLDPTKTKLRIGFVSADLHYHPVSYYLYKVLAGMNQDDFEFVLYHNNQYQDDLTHDYKSLAHKYETIDQLSDEAAAKMIFEDEIDLLFDMSGFTKGHRLRIFKYKPAPVQVSHIGYFGTLGMKEMDFVIADEHLVKEDEEQYFTESVYKMASCYVHCDSYDLPDAVSQAPCLTNNYVSFASMNTSHKISSRVIAVWAEILKRCPNTKLVIDNRFVESMSGKFFIEKRFREHGVMPDRLVFRSSIERDDFIQTYNEVDIALDPFPCGGGTSTIESLMMGVPVVTINGDRWLGRQSTGFLINAGHGELIATDVEDYIKKAVDLANDQARIQDYRMSLKQDLMSSEMNLASYVLRFEKAIRDMWLLKSQEVQR